MYHMPFLYVYLTNNERSRCELFFCCVNWSLIRRSELLQARLLEQWPRCLLFVSWCVIVLHHPLLALFDQKAKLDVRYYMG